MWGQNLGIHQVWLHVIDDDISVNAACCNECSPVVQVVESGLALTAFVVKEHE